MFPNTTNSKFIHSKLILWAGRKKLRYGPACSGSLCKQALCDSPWAFLYWHSHTYLCSVCLWLGFIFTNLLYSWYLRAVLNLLIETSI